MFLLLRRSLVLQADMAQGLSNNCCATTSNGCGQLKRQKALVSTYENVNKLEGEWKMNKRGTKRRCRLSSSSSTPFLLVVGPQYRKEEEEGRPGSSSFSSTQILHARSNGVYFAAAATVATKTFPHHTFFSCRKTNAVAHAQNVAAAGLDRLSRRKERSSSSIGIFASCNVRRFSGVAQNTHEKKMKTIGCV